MTLPATSSSISMSQINTEREYGSTSQVSFSTLNPDLGRGASSQFVLSNDIGGRTWHQAAPASNYPYLYNPLVWGNFNDISSGAAGPSTFSSTASVTSSSSPRKWEGTKYAALYPTCMYIPDGSGVGTRVYGTVGSGTVHLGGGYESGYQWSVGVWTYPLSISAAGAGVIGCHRGAWDWNTSTGIVFAVTRTNTGNYLFYHTNQAGSYYLVTLTGAVSLNTWQYVEIGGNYSGNLWGEVNGSGSTHGSTLPAARTGTKYFSVGGYSDGTIHGNSSYGYYQGLQATTNANSGFGGTYSSSSPIGYHTATTSRFKTTL